MYETEIRSEHHPLRTAFALAAALIVNGAVGATILDSGIDNRLAREGAPAAHLVADLGTLPTISVLACRAKV